MIWSLRSTKRVQQERNGTPICLKNVFFECSLRIVEYNVRYVLLQFFRQNPNSRKKPCPSHAAQHAAAAYWRGEWVGGARRCKTVEARRAPRQYSTQVAARACKYSLRYYIQVSGAARPVDRAAVVSRRRTARESPHAAQRCLHHGYAHLAPRAR